MQSDKSWDGSVMPSLDEIRCVETGGHAKLGLVLAGAAPAVAVTVTWVLCQNAAWAWVLQDSLGMSLMALILRQFRLPSVQACLAPCMLACTRWLGGSHWAEGLVGRQLPCEGASTEAAMARA